MAKELPDWAIVGARVLVNTPGSPLRVTQIDRVTLTSAYAGARRYVRPRFSDDGERLQEHGNADAWGAVPTIYRLESDVAQHLLERDRRLKQKRDFDAVMDNVRLTERADMEAHLTALIDLENAVTVRVAQLQDYIAQRKAVQ